MLERLRHRQHLLSRQKPVFRVSRAENNPPMWIVSQPTQAQKECASTSPARQDSASRRAMDLWPCRFQSVGPSMRRSTRHGTRGHEVPTRVLLSRTTRVTRIWVETVISVGSVVLRARDGLASGMALVLLQCNLCPLRARQRSPTRSLKIGTVEEIALLKAVRLKVNPTKRRDGNGERTV